MKNSPEESRKFDFTQLSEELSLFLDLSKQLKLTLLDHSRWGILELFQQKGIVDDIDGYENLLKGIVIDENVLAQVKLFLMEMGRESLKVVFNPGTLPLYSFYKTLFHESGIVGADSFVYFDKYLQAVVPNTMEPTISFVPGQVVDGYPSMRPCDPVTEWLFWRRDLDKNLRRLLVELQSRGNQGLFPNYQAIFEHFKYTAKYTPHMLEHRFPKWTDLSADDYKAWCRFYLQAPDCLGLPLNGKDKYSIYPGYVHAKSGLTLGTGVVRRPAPSAMAPFCQHLSAYAKDEFGMRSWTDMQMPEPVFVAPDRQDPWVATKMVF